MINCDKDSFICWIISREISKLGKKLNVQIKFDHMPVIDSYTINQISSYFDNLTIVLFYFYFSFSSR